MFDPSRGVTLSFAGWLWADLLLGLFVIFAVATTVGPARPVGASPGPAVASAVASASAAPAPAAAADAPLIPGVDPRALELTLRIDGPTLLGGDARAVAAEQERIAAEVLRAVGRRRVALVLAYGSSADARSGERIAAVATSTLRGGVFDGAALKAFHNLVAGDRGSTLQLSVYLFQDR